MKTTTLHPLRVALDIEDRTSDSHLVTYAIDVARDSGAIDRDYTEEGTPAELDALTPSIERLRLTFNIRDEVGADGVIHHVLLELWRVGAIEEAPSDDRSAPYSPAGVHPMLGAAYITERRELFNIYAGVVTHDTTEERAEFEAEMLRRRKARAKVELDRQIRQAERGLETLRARAVRLDQLNELPDDVWAADDVLAFLRDSGC